MNTRHVTRPLSGVTRLYQRLLTGYTADPASAAAGSMLIYDSARPSVLTAHATAPRLKRATNWTTKGKIWLRYNCNNSGIYGF